MNNRLTCFCVVCLSFVVQLTTLSAQNLSGTLCDYRNDPLAGVIVSNKANGRSTVTDKYGNFILDGHRGDTVEVIDKGKTIYAIEMTSSSDNRISVSLPDYFKSVSNMGWTIDRFNTSAAIDMIGSEDIDDNSFLNTSHSLFGKLASLTALQNGSLPGSDGVSLTVRGKSTFNGSAPLILVDGFEASLSDLTAREIESVSVLKDGVATALYGIRGANGVVIVNTKKGTAGSPEYKFGVNYGLVMPSDIPESVDAKTYSMLVNEARYYDGLSPRYTKEQIALQGSDKYLYPDVDWTDYMLRNSSNIVNANAQVTAGKGRVKFYSLLDFSCYDGSLKNTGNHSTYSLQNKYNSLNARANISMDVAKNTVLEARIGMRMKTQVNNDVGIDSYYDSLLKTPANRYVPLNEDGSYGGNNHYRENPLAQIDGQGFQDSHYRSMNVNLTLNHGMDYLLEGLGISAAISFISTFTTNENYSTGGYSVSELIGYDAVTGVPLYDIYGQSKVLTYSGRGASQWHSGDYKLSLNYSASKGIHSLDAAIIGQISEYVDKNNAQPFRYMNLSAVVNWGIADRYFWDFVANGSGTNGYSRKNRSGFFPAVGFSWIASNEDFLKHSAVLDYLKVKTSFGVTGCDNYGGYGRFMWFDNYAGGSVFRYGETATTTNTGLSESTVANPYFTFETDKKFNIGIESGFFDCLEFYVDFFYEHRSRIAQSVDDLYTDIIGRTLQYENTGKVRKLGFDITASYKKAFSSDFSLGVDLNIGLSKNKILEYNELENAVKSYVGESIGGIYGYIADGLYRDEEDVAESPKNTFFDVRPGDIKYVDRNDDKVIDNYDCTLIGNNYPLLSAGLSLYASAKGFYIRALFDMKACYDVRVDDCYVYSPLSGGYGNISKYYAANRWTTENADNASFPRLTTFTSSSNRLNNTLFLKDASHLRLRTAEIGYKWSAEKLKKIHLSSIKLFVRGHNLFTLDNFQEVDPETISGYPMLRYFNFGINLDF